MNCLESQRISIEKVDAVYRLVQQTITTVYPNYYFPEAVEFFCQIHNRGAIAKDILEGAVYGLFQGKELLATGSYHNGHIARLFVAPNLRGQGLGGRLLEDLEYRIIAQEQTKAVLDASRPAEEFYRHRGYYIVRQKQLTLESGAVLAWNVMEKQLSVSPR
ncbi:MAG TPA: GNAT family N-acetyltransferase [Candidatus Egerieicola pullicola]|uniref:GNAT family N-acetyltransferase n=1 Tax=Candidatus Egerieicola pullicola TaxID=2840775 RepID=A0A9D1AJ49_9FIRM|nr:GNAT family N-acetyltransferase [Candidatus Egerieicola pullicola]